MRINGHEEFRDRMSSGNYRKIKSLDASPATNAKEAVAIPSKMTGRVYESGYKVTMESNPDVEEKQHPKFGAGSFWLQVWI